MMYKNLMKTIRRNHGVSRETYDTNEMVDSLGSYNQSLLNLPHSKDKQVYNIIVRLVEIVEAGRGGDESITRGAV
ncbi:hypothetical protein I5Q45_18735 [Serratia marcescens]|nr:hypothetical protein [Serratia marcescens]